MQHMFHFLAHGNCENVIFWLCSHLKYDHAVPQVGQLASLAKSKNTSHLHGETQRITCAIQTGKCLLPGTMKRIALWFAHCALENMVKRQKGKSMQRKKSRSLQKIIPQYSSSNPLLPCEDIYQLLYPFPLGHTSFWKFFSNPFFGYYLNAKLSYV